MHKLGLKHWCNAALLLFATGLLAGCAGQRLHTEGMALIEQGRAEEGLAKIEEASKVEPGNLTYRADLMRSRGQITNRLLASANSERAVGKLDAAQAIYERILKIDPTNNSAKAGLESLAMDRRHDAMVVDARSLLQKGELDNARTALKPVLLENPKNGQASLLMRQIDEQTAKEQVSEPALMTKFKKPVSMQFRDASVKMVFEALSRASGVNILLDKDVRPDIKTSIFVKDVSVEDAIDLILLQSQLEKKVISDNTLFIYPNTPLKTKEYQDLKIRSFHLTNADPKQMMAMIKSMLKTKDIFVHEKTNSLVMRDTPEAIRLAEKMVADQDIADPEVMLEVEVIEISRSRLSEIGVKFPTQLTFTTLQGLAGAPGPTVVAGATVLPAANVAQLTLNSLRQINGSLIGVSPAPSITLNAMLQDGDTNLLASPRIRVRNREKAKIMIGERVPMITNSVTPVATGTPVVTGTVTYQDVGLKLDVEPEIHLDNEVSIKIGLEVSSLGLAVDNPSGSTVYRVGTRNTSTVLRLKDGETQILAGLIQDDEKSTASKVPGLGQLPIAGRLFSSKKDDATKTEIILSITPRIVGNNRPQNAREVEYWSGTEATLRSNPLVMKPLGTIAPSASAAVRTQTVNTPGAVAPAPVVPAPVVPAPVAPAPVAPTPVAPAPVAPAPVAPAPVAPAPVAPAPVAPGVAAPNAFMPAAFAPAAAPSANGKDNATQPQQFFWQGPSQVKVGDKIRLTLNTQSIQGVKSLGFQVGFAPDVLKANDVVEGNLMRHMVLPSTMAKTIDQAGGKIQVDMSGAGAGSSGSVVTLIFEATAAAQQSPITVGAVTSSGVSGEALAIAEPVPYYLSVAQ